jgi:Protein of unknown function (DUF3168)
VIEADLVTWLNAQSGLTNLVGARIYPEKAREGDPYPYLTYTLVSRKRPGRLQGRDTMPFARYQLDTASATKADCGNVMAQVLAAVDALQATLGVGKITKIGNTVLGSVALDDDRDGYQPPVRADDVGIYWRSADLLLWYRE